MFLLSSEAPLTRSFQMVWTAATSLAYSGLCDHGLRVFSTNPDSYVILSRLDMETCVSWDLETSAASKLLSLRGTDALVAVGPLVPLPQSRPRHDHKVHLG